LRQQKDFRVAIRESDPSWNDFCVVQDDQFFRPYQFDKIREMKMGDPAGFPLQKHHPGFIPSLGRVSSNQLLWKLIIVICSPHLQEFRSIGVEQWSGGALE
jgi:hypothetical protein